MQNLPITATPPASPAQQTVSTDSNPTQAAEPFSNVLARQRANASTPDKDARGSKQATPSSASDSSPASGDEQSTELQAPAPDTVSTLPGDMLAALLPASHAAKGIAAGKDKTDPDTPANVPNAAAALPGDMLAALLPAPLAANGSTTDEKTRPQESASNGASSLPDDKSAAFIFPSAAPQESGATMRPQPVAMAAPGEPLKSTGSQAAPVLSRVQDNTRSTVLSRAQDSGGSTPPAANANIVHGSAFAATLEGAGRDGARVAQTGANTTEFSAQTAPPDAVTNLSILTQSGPAPIAASPNVPAQAVVNTPVAHDAWGDEFGQKVTWLATQNTQSAELHLNPPQLGPLDVVLNVSGDQATALFTSPHAAVRDAVEQALPRLREMLADNGIMLGNATVSDQSPKDQQAWLTGQQQNGSRNLSGRAGGVTATDGILSGGTVMPVRRHQGMVDTFA